MKQVSSETIAKKLVAKFALDTGRAALRRGAGRCDKKTLKRVAQAVAIAVLFSGCALRVGPFELATSAKYHTTQQQKKY